MTLSLSGCLQGVKSLFTTLVVSLPAFANVGALIGLILFMYAYLGVLLFGSVARQVGGSTCAIDVMKPIRAA